ncbi:hypothetical protein SRHO_G00256070 [Serrasalmus rhombeus]
MVLFRSLIYLTCSVFVSLSSSVIHSPELDHVTVMSASGEEFQSAVGEELESDGASGLFTNPPIPQDLPPSDLISSSGILMRIVSSFFSQWGEQRSPELEVDAGETGGKGGIKSQVTLGQRSHTSSQVQHTFSTTSDPCLTSHRDYCIHGHCTYLQDLKEPVCVCMKGYDGVRCGIQLLQTFSGSGSGSDGTGRSLTHSHPAARSGHHRCRPVGHQLRRHHHHHHGPV